MKIKRQDLSLELNEPRVTHQMWKLGRPIDADVFFIKMFERPIPALVERNKDRYYLAEM